VTIFYKGEKLDSHLPFSVGIEPEEELNFVVIVASIILFIIGVIVFNVMLKRFNAKKAEE